MTSRRGVLIGGVSAFGGGLILPAQGLAQQWGDKDMRMPHFKGNPFKALEKKVGGRLGVYAMQGTRGVGYNEGERFAMCSTFKWLLAAAVLETVDQGKYSLERRVAYTEADLLEYAPVTRANLATGYMTIAALCEAAVAVSDNTAANLLLPFVGGPAGLTAFVRRQGDKVTRFDRNEPSLNTNIKGDPRDTTTPEAMTHLLIDIYRRRVLSPESLLWLKRWMIATSTGNDRIRAAASEDWVVGDKTGTGANGATNDVGIMWPPTQDAIFISIYYTGGKQDQPGRNKVIAEAARLAVAGLA